MKYGRPKRKAGIKPKGRTRPAGRGTAPSKPVSRRPKSTGAKSAKKR